MDAPGGAGDQSRRLDRGLRHRPGRRPPAHSCSARDAGEGDERASSTTTAPSTTTTRRQRGRRQRHPLRQSRCASPGRPASSLNVTGSQGHQRHHGGRAGRGRDAATWTSSSASATRPTPKAGRRRARPRRRSCAGRRATRRDRWTITCPTARPQHLDPGDHGHDRLHRRADSRRLLLRQPRRRHRLDRPGPRRHPRDLALTRRAVGMAPDYARTSPWTTTATAA